MRKLLTFVVIVVVVVVLAIVQLVRPVPQPALTMTIPSSYKVPGITNISLPTSGQAAVMASGVGVLASTANETSVPIASLTKIMTAYLVLKAHPLAVGADGPTYTITPEDVAVYNQDVQQGDSVMKVAAGETLTERQMLEGLLLPSSDNLATTLAKWVAGSESSFIEQMNQTAKSLGMANTTYHDVSGVSPQTVSTAVDQLTIANLAMKDPTFREIVSMPQATLPVSGTVYNVNNMIGKQGIVGVKTGSTDQAGGCFVSAMYANVGGKQVLMLGAVLGQGGYYMLQNALNKSVSMLHQAQSDLRQVTLPQTQGVVGTYSMPWSSDVQVSAAHPVSVIGYPGMTVKYSLTATDLSVQAGAQSSQVGVILQSPLPKPSMKWRLLRL